MTSTPTPDQIPMEEQPVLEALVSIKHRLTAIKKDRSRFIKTSTVTALYDELSTQLQALEEIRGPSKIWGTRNNVNSVLDEVFVILSLCFMAVGKTKESPATYVQLLTIKVSTIFMCSLSLLQRTQKHSLVTGGGGRFSFERIVCQIMHPRIIHIAHLTNLTNLTTYFSPRLTTQ